MPGYKVLSPKRKPSASDATAGRRTDYRQVTIAANQNAPPSQMHSGPEVASALQKLPAAGQTPAHQVSPRYRLSERAPIPVPYFRQKAAAQLPAGDAAGLLEGTKFHGRTNPLLGPGLPPQDDYDPPSTHEHHKGWHPMHLQKRDIIGQAGYRGVPADHTKPSKRVFGAPPADEQHLHGAAVGITVDNPPERKARGWGERPAYTHYNTANRTILASTSGAAVNGDTSPRRAFARKVDMARPGDHPDVLRYRYSNGLCPDVYQFDTRRTPAPQVSLKTQDALSQSYFSARHECNVNRARAEGDTEVHFYHEMFMPRPATAPQW
ncbi:hypothetical protein WJX77_003403 [Trebouxia sp. C0004]